MVPLLLFIGFGIFAFGLFQWALGGESLWKMFKLRRKLEKQDSKGRPWRDTPQIRAEERARAQERADTRTELENLEKSADSVLRSSLRIVGMLAIGAWLIVGLMFLLDALGVNWAHRLTTHASSYWKAETPNNMFDKNTNAARNDMLHKMGTGVKK